MMRCDRSALLVLALVLCVGASPFVQAKEIYRDAAQPVDNRVEDLLKRLTFEEKLAFIAGADGNTLPTVDRLGIPSLKVTDGPHGVGWGVKSTCFPTAVGMGASWNPEMVRKVGAAMAREVRAVGRHVLLGPCVNIHRTPLGGRNFESFCEDPYLAARLAVAYVQGVQGEQIGTSTKHFACNNQEYERNSIDAKVDQRALREIYLPAFKAAVQEANTWTVMAAYNRLNGHYCCANKELLTDILKDEWGFRGVVVSDWDAIHSTEKTALAGCDLEMPGPGKYFGEPLRKAIEEGRVGQDVIDEKVRRILRVIIWAGLLDGVEKERKGEIATEAHARIAREMAQEAIVLIKNDGGALPLDEKEVKSIAVIGPNAAIARVGGGGSSTVAPENPISPLEGLKSRLGESVLIQHDEGCVVAELYDIPSEWLVPTAGSPGEHGLRAEYFDNVELAGEPVLTRVDKQVSFDWDHGKPDERLPMDNFSVRWTGTLTPRKGGLYSMGVRSDDGMRLYIDGELIISDWRDHAPLTVSTDVEFEAGKSYDIRLEYFERIGGAVVKMGWVPPGERIPEDALKIARESDVAVIFAGLSKEFEGEGGDRASMDMPGPQAQLIREVAQANKNTIVVLVNGTPVTMDNWVDHVPAVLEAWYPGQEGGHAIADVLFGDVNPSGKMPVTFPKKLEDNPSHGNFPGSEGVVRYEESLMVGYRHYDTKKVEPQIPFGHGLSYTTFEYSDLQISPRKVRPGGKVRVSVDVENTGSRTGKEVVQLYVHDVESALERPYKELKGFQKVQLAPGEKRTVTLELGKDALSYYEPGKGWVAEPGRFEILVGSSSRDIRLRGRLTLARR